MVALFRISILSPSLSPHKRQDDIVVATGVDKMAVEVADMVVDMEVDKVANMELGGHNFKILTRLHTFNQLSQFLFSS